MTGDCIANCKLFSGKMLNLYFYSFRNVLKTDGEIFVYQIRKSDYDSKELLGELYTSSIIFLLSQVRVFLFKKMDLSISEHTRSC